MSVKTNTFWVGANIIFDLDTGKTSNVLMLVNSERDAAEFHNITEANKYLLFVSNRTKNIQWFLDAPVPQRPTYVIRGIQTVQISR